MKQTKSSAAKNILSKASVAGLVSGHTTLLQATLWGRNFAARESQPDIAYSPSPGAQMLSDLVLASDGELLSCSDSGISASYKSARHAITAVRHMQQLVKGFSEVAAAGPLYSSFTLQYADQADDLSDSDLSLVPSSRSESEAVILIGDICADAKTIPGLRFKESTSTAQKKRGKVLELLASTRAPQSQEVSPRIEIAPAIKAPSPITGPKTPTAQRKIPPTSTPKPATTARLTSPIRPDTPPALQVFLARARTTLAGAFRSRLVAGSILGVLAIIAVGATVKHFAQSKSQVQPQSATPQPLNPAPTPAVVSPPVAKAPAAAVAAAPLSTAEPRSTHTQSILKPETAAPPKPRPPARERVAENPDSGSLKYTRSDIEQMLARADRASGDGKYDQAITTYNLILRQDGRNSAALAGRDRAIRNKRLQ